MHLLDPLLNRVFHEKSVDVYSFFLSDSVYPVDSLVLVRWIPPGITDHYIIRHSQIESGSSSTKRHDHKRAVLRVLEYFHIFCSRHFIHVTCNWCPFHSSLVHFLLKNLYDLDPLREYHTLLLPLHYLLHALYHCLQFAAIWVNHAI